MNITEKFFSFTLFAFIIGIYLLNINTLNTILMLALVIIYAKLCLIDHKNTVLNKIKNQHKLPPVKQIIVMRKDLKNAKGHKVHTGKLIAQGSHAAMAFLTNKIRNKKALSYEEYLWIENSFTKVVLAVNSEQELLEIHQKALDNKLTSHLITDNGLTEFNGTQTPTCLAIGPHYEPKFNNITSHLSLF